MTPEEKTWHIEQLAKIDPKGQVAKYDATTDSIDLSDSIRCDESRNRPADPEELARAVALALLCSSEYEYSTDALYVERYYKHGHPSSKRDEVDLVILDEEDLPFAMWEFKTPSEFDAKADEYIEYQLFGTAPLVGMPQVLVFATVRPTSKDARLEVLVIDYNQFKSWDGWCTGGSPAIAVFPKAYKAAEHKPYVREGEPDLRTDYTSSPWKNHASRGLGDLKPQLS